MTEISFYHLQKSHLEEALPLLLEKTLELGKRAIVMVGSSAYAEQLNTYLWDYQKGAWLPHGTNKDGQGENQPIWLTSVDENPNGATFLFLADGAHSADISAYERCFEMFDGNNTAQYTRARKLWQSYKDAGHPLKYLKQNDRGEWEEKAIG
jgi:DNA polymerase-3 subunit chi